MVFATVIVNVCVPVAPAASSTVMVTLWDPTSSLVGVPASTPVLAVNVSQLGADALSVSVSPLSTSAPVAVYVYAASSLTAVTAVLEMVGASLVFDTTTSNVWVPVALEPSVTVTVTLAVPTSSFVGVPAIVAVPSPASVSVNHEGQLHVIAAESPESTSAVVMEYE